MPYAEVAHVKARAGYLAGAWGEATQPGHADIEVALANVADEIDAAIVGLGQSVPVADSIAAKALVGLNADGALLIALDATFPAGEGPSAATELQRAVRDRYERAWALLLAGKHPAVTAPLASGEPSTVPSATDFWQENPRYGVERSDPESPNEALDPYVVRGQRW